MVDFIHKVRVRYSDTDSFGVVYFANYLQWVEQARTELLRKWKNVKDFEGEGWAFPFVDVHVKYQKPAEIDDQLVVEVSVKKLGNSSICLDFDIKKMDGDDIDVESVCCVETVSVCLFEREKHDLPDELRKVLSKFVSK